MQPSAVDSMDKYNENLTDVKEIFRKGDLRAIPKPLLKWYDNNRRILPWREDPAPYRVWVSEIMLQQTRVEAVKPYFQRFMETLPDIAALAQAPEEVLLKLWEGLGYYNRVRNLQKAAIQIMEDYGGVMPDSYEELLKLKGIGSYTAGAVSSIAYGKPNPAVGTSITFLIFSGILILLSVIYFICQHTGKKKIAASVLIFILCCGLGYSDSFAFWQKDLTYEGESIYNYLQVSETDRQVVLSTNVLFGVQSLYMKEGGLTGMYYDYAMAAPLMVPDKPVEDMDVLILGMGTGTYATQCRKYFGDMNIEGVEIDEKITELSREYFSLPEDVKVTTYDGRAFLQAVDTTYDVIMVDAYQDITIPFQMSSVEFFTMVKDHLKDGGVMVVNMNMHGNKEGDINQYLADTIANVFDNVYTVDVAGSTNRELFASQHSDMIEVLSDHVENLSDAGLQNMMQRVADNSSAYVTGDYLMTDDKAPVELLGMQVIDQLIQEEVAYYKDIYEEQGISGLMEHL